MVYISSLLFNTNSTFQYIAVKNNVFATAEDGSKGLLLPNIVGFTKGIDWFKNSI